jgi:16S rRNA (cytosine1407-C5)-methyltransferase
LGEKRGLVNNLFSYEKVTVDLNARKAQNTQNIAFDAYYRAIYGSRWASLRESLLAPAPGAAYGEGLDKPYRLDQASVLAAKSLRLPSELRLSTEAGPPPESGEILDACAAPGGKALVIAGRMGGERLLANELSAERRRRLQVVLDEHLGPEKRERVRVSGFDAAAAGARRGEWGRFDAILLDAPCSSERHVLADPGALALWSAARPRFLAGRQWALLSAAFLLLKAGGSLVYATCSINPGENDGVVRRLLEKYGASVLPDPPDFTAGEACQYGRIILPDNSHGGGPMYVARFRKL